MFVVRLSSTPSILEVIQLLYIHLAVRLPDTGGKAGLYMLLVA